MVHLLRAAILLATMVSAGSEAHAQQQSAAEEAYFRAMARYFQLPESELGILASWDLPPDEIPVLLFVARRAGVSAEALAALRESGRSWTELSARYRIGASALHVPLHDPASAGRLATLYASFRDTPVSHWGEIALQSEDIVALVNVRVLAQSLGLPPDEVMRRTSGASSFVELYGRLIS